MSASNLPSRSGCPCVHTQPCHPRCTCVTPLSSRGCHRCASYGSEAQRRARAEFIAAAISAADAASTATSGPEFSKRRDGLYISENGFDRSKPPILHTEYAPTDKTACYLQLSSEPVAHCASYQGTVIVDKDERGKVRGVEFLGGEALE